jgi:hypothetical protein
MQYPLHGRRPGSAQGGTLIVSAPATQDDTAQPAAGGMTQAQLEQLWGMVQVLRQKVEMLDAGVTRLEASLAAR